MWFLADFHLSDHRVNQDSALWPHHFLAGTIRFAHGWDWSTGRIEDSAFDSLTSSGFEIARAGHVTFEFDGPVGECLEYGF
jgi:hypothetical protein